MNKVKFYNIKINNFLNKTPFLGDMLGMITTILITLF